MLPLLHGYRKAQRFHPGLFACFYKKDTLRKHAMTVAELSCMYVVFEQVILQIFVPVANHGHQAAWLQIYTFGYKS